jgi:hypothetical protein
MEVAGDDRIIEDEPDGESDGGGVDWRARYDESCQVAALAINQERLRADRAEAELAQLRKPIRETCIMLIADLMGLAEILKPAEEGDEPPALPEATPGVVMQGATTIAGQTVLLALAEVPGGFDWIVVRGRDDDEEILGRGRWTAGGEKTPPLQTADGDGDGGRQDACPTDGEGVAGEAPAVQEVAGEAPAVHDAWQPTIAIDLDGVLAHYAGWTGEFTPIGDPVEGAWDFCQELHRQGWRIIIHTCRGDLEEVRNWLAAWTIAHDGINSTAHNAPGSSDGKPIADVYLDDRAIRFEGRFLEVLDRIEAGVEPWWAQG